MERSNALAKANGIRSENVFGNYMKTKNYHVKQLNDLIDMVVDGSYVEIKSCQDYILDRSHKNVVRKGRFVLDEEQHEFLVGHDGYYVFVLNFGHDTVCATKRFRILKARRLKFQKLIVWPKIFEVN